jgi:hypothetical protein
MRVTYICVGKTRASLHEDLQIFTLARTLAPYSLALLALALVCIALSIFGRDLLVFA